MRRPSRLFHLLLGAAACFGVGLALHAWAGNAAVPGGLAYSGMLRDGNGTPVAGPHKFDFELLDGNTVLCSDSRQLTVAGGRFDAPGLFAMSCPLDAHLAAHPALTVRISVDGSTLQPPQPLGSVPYAARARFAEQPVVPSTAGGRLTLSAKDPAPLTDVAAANTLNYLPYNGQLVALFDGTNWAYRDIGGTGVSKSLGMLAAATVHDVFLYDNAGTLDLEFAPWMANMRMTPIARVDGVWVKQADATRRYLGTIRTTAMGVCDDTNNHRFVWNVQNRLVRRSRTYEQNGFNFSISVQQPTPMANGSLVWRHEYVIGLDEEAVEATASAQVHAGGGSGRANIGIGLDANTFSADATYGTANAGFDCGQMVESHFRGPLGPGYHYLQALANTCGAAIDYFVGPAPSGAFMTSAARM